MKIQTRKHRVSIEYTVTTDYKKRNGENTMKKTVLDTRTNTVYTVTKNDNGTFTLDKVKGNGDTKKTLKSTKLFDNGTLTEYTETEKKHRVMKTTSKCNPQKTAETIATFKDSLLEFLDSYEKDGYTAINEQAKANKINLVYIKNNKKRNIAEIFVKARLNTIAFFIREENLMNGIEYDKELAQTHKEHRFNFWIEKHVKNDGETFKTIVAKIIENHKTSIANA